MPMSVKWKKIGRNTRCPCGSGKKYKKCCIGVRERLSPDVLRAAEDLARRQPNAVDDFAPPPEIRTSWRGKTVRAIWNRIVLRPQSETFHEFLLAVLNTVFGRRWFEIESAKSADDRHVVARWADSWARLSNTAAPPDHKPGIQYSAPSTGETNELLTMARDLYVLQRVNRLPGALKKRLRLRDAFQGARYEVAIAASFVRCGFSIEWIRDQSKKGPEFIATHESRRLTIAVETKSRHRRGTLHQRGPAAAPEELVADVQALVREAVKQRIGGVAFAIFVDVNLPLGQRSNEGKPRWWSDVTPIFESYSSGTAPYEILSFTNLSWHFDGGDEIDDDPELLMSHANRSEVPLTDVAAIKALFSSLMSYGLIPPDA